MMSVIKLLVIRRDQTPTFAPRETSVESAAEKIAVHMGVSPDEVQQEFINFAWTLTLPGHLSDRTDYAALLCELNEALDRHGERSVRVAPLQAYRTDACLPAGV